MVSLLCPDTKPQLGLHFNFKSPHFSCLFAAGVMCAVSFRGKGNNRRLAGAKSFFNVLNIVCL